ncbi:acyltransferase [Epilithonimonas sp. FP105]|uniref:acyltransferase family protein n=1 Tax=Chryseobacterium group TaxID=2782232 RepID=UPI000A874E9D|nr:acyltransferase [Epilithonimonas sp. FP105]
MSISVQKSNQLKVVAILMMLCLHLFNRNYKGLFEPFLFVGKQPLVFYWSLFCDACMPIFAFVSGYGLYYKFQNDKAAFANGNFARLKRLYVNYWIIILIFPVTLGLILKFPDYPGSITKVIYNIIAFDNSYNGAWWFFTTYVIFVFTSNFWFILLQRLDPYLYIFILFIVYIVYFYLRLNRFWEERTSFEVLNIFLKDLILFFYTLSQFMLGAFALKYNWNKIVSQWFKNIRYKNITILILISGLIVLHATIPNFIISPFIALCFIFLFCQIELGLYISKGLDFLIPHSTNIWLIHMFFYSIFFPSFIYSFRYPSIIFFMLLMICVLCSYVINFINLQIQKLIK